MALRIESSTPQGTPEAEARAQRRTALASLVAAGVLVVLKLGTGLLSGSLALVSGGVESSGDVLAALLTLLAIRLAVQPADRDHNYGHRRAENLAALGEAAIVVIGGGIIAFEAVRRLSEGGGELDAGWEVFTVIGLALVIDVSRIVISLRAARRWGSAAFRSNAYNFAGDLAGSLAVLIGLALVAAGFAAGDAIAALVVAAVIFAAAARLIVDNARALMDYAPQSARSDIEAAIAGVEPVVELRRLRLREVAGRVFADVAIGLSPATAVTASHDLADRVEDAVRSVAPGSDVVVHVEPLRDGVTLRERILALALSDEDIVDAHDIAIFTRRGRSVVALHIKLDRDRSIGDAHRAAERVEAAICALDEVDAAHTHIEPLERPVALRRAPRKGEELADTVRSVVGAAMHSLEVLDTDAGPVLFLTVGVVEGESLTTAHAEASELEEELWRALPQLAEVVVHTEPRG